MGIIPDRYFTEISRRFRGGKGKELPDAPQNRMSGWLALSPLLVFLGVYLISSLIVRDFYKIPIAAAFLIASVYALLICRGRTVDERIAIFSKGAGNNNVLLMIWIFILAGAFAASAKDMGAIDATVNLTLRLLPGNMLYAGIFLASCFISMAIGTSVGTIVALVPVAAGIAAETGIALPFMTAVVVGGAFFGDNLSFISDTTIAATRTQGCRMSDKFKVNIKIVGPAAVIITGVYLFMGSGVELNVASEPMEWLKLLPYISVIGLALSGMNVASVLVLGIAASAVIGFACGDLSWTGWLASLGRGIGEMGGLIIVTMLAGGMLEVIRVNGGLDAITGSMTGHIRGSRGAEFSIAALVGLANICTANNTIAIITTGRLAKDISEKFGLDPRKVASILDTFSCLVQGFLPYGAQLLMASGLAGISAFSIMGHLYYPFAMGIFAALAIIFRYPKHC